MHENISIHREGDIYSIFTAYHNGDEGHEVHLVYDTEGFYFESIHYLNEDYEDLIVEDYSACTDEELFQYSTVYPYSQYMCFEKLVVIQKWILKHEKEISGLDSIYDEDYNIDIKY